MDAPGSPRRTPSLGSFDDAAPRRSRRTLIRPATRPSVVAFIIPAARTRPYQLDVPLGVTVYELSISRGVRILRQGGGFWDPSLIPQASWVWGFRTEGASLDLRQKYAAHADVHEAIVWSRSRERMVPGRHPLELEACRKYLHGKLQRAVQAELERKGLVAAPEADPEDQEPKASR